jgi:hypothetical protein
VLAAVPRVPGGDGVSEQEVAKGEGQMGSYEWVTLRDTNLNYVCDRTGIAKEDLKKILRNAKDKGITEVKVPVGVRAFTREER